MNEKQAERARQSLVAYAVAGKLRGMRGSAVHRAQPEDLADAILGNKHHHKVLSGLSTGKTVEYSGNTVSAEELSRFRSEMGIAGRDLLKRLHGGMPPEETTWFLRPLGAALSESAFRLDRAFFKVNPSRCLRIRASTDDEGVELGLPSLSGRGLVGRTLVCLLERTDPSHDNMPRFGWLRPASTELHEQGLDDNRIERLVDMMIEESHGRSATLRTQGWMSGHAAAAQHRFPA